MDKSINWQAPKVGIGVVVWRKEDNTVLVGMRAGSNGAGEWGLPGGKMDPGEMPEQTAIRETKEESGLSISSAKALPFYSFDTFAQSGQTFVTLYYLAEYTEDAEDAEPKRCEPEKCLEWRWVPWQADLFPKPLFCGIANLAKKVPDLSVARLF